MYPTSTDSAIGVPLIVMVCVAFIYYLCNDQSRKKLMTIWWWLCPAVFAIWSLINFGDLWGAIKTGLVSIFWVGIPGGIMLSHLANKK
jgi:hypothetical protein